MMQVQKSRSTSEVRESVYLAVVDGLVLVGIGVRVPTTFQREPITCLQEMAPLNGHRIHSFSTQRRRG